MTKVLDSMLLAGVALAGACAEEKPARTPNVVFILAVDLGWGDLSCYGQKNYEVPNMDHALARGGVRFTQCYSGTTVSAPSRSCLLTGTHSGHTPVRENLELDPEGQFRFLTEPRRSSHDMRKAGYRTGAFGKWGLGYIGTTGDPANQDSWISSLASIASFSPTATMRATSGITRKELNWKTMWTLSLTGRERIFQNLSMKKLSNSSKIGWTENPSFSGIRPQYRTPS